MLAVISRNADCPSGFMRSKSHTRKTHGQGWASLLRRHRRAEKEDKSHAELRETTFLENQTLLLGRRRLGPVNPKYVG